MLFVERALGYIVTSGLFTELEDFVHRCLFIDHLNMLPVQIAYLASFNKLVAGSASLVDVVVLLRAYAWILVILTWEAGLSLFSGMNKIFACLYLARYLFWRTAWMRYSLEDFMWFLFEAMVHGLYDLAVFALFAFVVTAGFAAFVTAVYFGIVATVLGWAKWRGGHRGAEQRTEASHILHE